MQNAYPLKKPPLAGLRTAREFGDHAPLFDDPPEERIVASRIEAVHSTGEERDRVAVAGQCRAMGHPVDSVRCAGDDREPPVDETGRCLHRDVLAVPGRRASTDERDRLPKRRHRLGSTPLPERDRRVLVQVPHGVDPVLVAGDAEPHAVAAGLPKGRERGRRGDSRLPPIQRESQVVRGERRSGAGLSGDQFSGVVVDERTKGSSGSERIDELARDPVARFRDARPARPGEPLLDRGPIEIR